MPTPLETDFYNFTQAHSWYKLFSDTKFIIIPVTEASGRDFNTPGNFDDDNIHILIHRADVFINAFKDYPELYDILSANTITLNRQNYQTFSTFLNVSERYEKIMEQLKTLYNDPDLFTKWLNYPDIVVRR